MAVYADDDGEAGDLVAEYQYDGQGRRTAKIVRQVDGQQNVTYDRTDYSYNESWQVLEERTGTFESLEGEGGARGTPAETPAVQWLWDIRYVDAPVLRWRDADADPETGDFGLEETVYYCQDANWNVTALVDAATGDVVERYMYAAYGKPTVLDEDWAPVEGNQSAVANDRLFQGQESDPETGLNNVRNRIYHVTLAVFLERDGWYIDGMNLYQFCRSSPTALTDPMGLCPGTTQAPHVAKDDTEEGYIFYDSNGRQGDLVEPTIKSTVEITEANGRLIIEVTASKGTPYSNTSGRDRLKASLDGNESDRDSAQVLVVAEDSSGGYVTSGHNIVPEAKRKEEKCAAKWQDSRDGNSATATVTVDTASTAKEVKVVNVIVVYTDVTAGPYPADKPAVIASWGMEKQGDKWHTTNITGHLTKEDANSVRSPTTQVQHTENTRALIEKMSHRRFTLKPRVDYALVTSGGTHDFKSGFDIVPKEGDY